MDGLVEVDRKIDGHLGRIAEGYNTEIDERMVMAGWIADTQTGVSIITTYPWDEGVRQLLNTINITRQLRPDSDHSSEKEHGD